MYIFSAEVLTAERQLWRSCRKKSTGFVRYRQGDHEDEYSLPANVVEQPVMGFDRSADRHGCFSMLPREYSDFMQAGLREEAEFTVADLMAMPKGSGRKTRFKASAEKK